VRNGRCRGHNWLAFWNVDADETEDFRDQNTWTKSYWQASQDSGFSSEQATAAAGSAFEAAAPACGDEP
jgi:hypothetical protein